MKLLSKPVGSITYDEIVEFAKENHPEGVELDYKKEPPDKDKLSQLVAAFANTRGGLIIIGVEENRENGRPTKWEGVKDDHYDELSAQVIGNISPIPNFEFHKTEEKNGKVFILIRVFEGDETPYYPHNDSNIWIRTGSIKKSVDLASPEYAELLFKKNEKAQIGRERNVLLARKNYKAFLTHSESERVRRLPMESEYLPKEPIGTNTAMLEVLVQPFHPHGRLIRPLDIESIIQNTQVENTHYSFPRRAGHWDSINEGMIQFNWERYSGGIDCQQIFANGLMFTSDNILRIHNLEGKFVHLAWFASQLYITLRGTRNILKELGYQGSVVGEMKVTGIKGTNVISIVRSIFMDEKNLSVFDEYSWTISTDTKTISNENELRKFVVEFVRDIHWSFGYKEIQKSITVERLEKDGYFAP